MQENLRLSQAQLDAVIEHARACKPEEACGILAGSSKGTALIVSRVFAMENAEHSNTTYIMDSQEQFRVFDEMEREGLEPVAIFHSHPHSPAFPSTRDIELAFYPDSAYLIVSLMNDEPDCHAFRIADERVREIEIIVEGADG